MIRLPQPEDLIVMKAVANRSQDHLDIEKILAFYPNLKLPRIRRWAREFSKVMDSPDIVKNLERLLFVRSRRRSKGPKTKKRGKIP